MTTPDLGPSDADDSQDLTDAARDRAAHIAWLVWLVGQATVLALYAVQFRWSGGYPRPIEATADLGIAAAQMILAALLSESLARTPGELARLLVAALPISTLATALSGTAPADAIRTALVTLVWIAALTQCRDRRTHAGAVLVTLAGPLLWYVALEYGQRDVPLGSWLTTVSPVLGVCSTRLHKTIFRPLVTASVAFLFVTVVTTLKKRVRWQSHELS